MQKTETYSMPTFTKRGQDLAPTMGIDAYQCVEEEELLEEKLRCLLLAPSKWQRVIHGSSFDYRFRVLRGMLELGQESKAEKFALCGRGDYVVQSESGGMKIIARRCGSRLCVRCARSRGWKFAHRVFDVLRDREHGYLHHVVLTQRTRPGETLEEARTRLRLKWTQMRGKRGIGYSGGLLVEHVKWSQRGKGWHPHYHVIMETDTEGVALALLERWRGYVAEEEGWNVEKAIRGEIGNPGFCREVASPGTPLFKNVDDQEMFWKEAHDDIAKALQYIVRDVTEGPDKEGFSSVSDARFTELMVGLRDARLHTLLGDWRAKKDPEDEADKEIESDEDAKKPAPKKSNEVAIGTVDDVIANEGLRVRFSYWLMDFAGGNTSPLAIRARALASSVLHLAGL